MTADEENARAKELGQRCLDLHRDIDALRADAGPIGSNRLKAAQASIEKAAGDVASWAAYRQTFTKPRSTTHEHE